MKKNWNFYDVQNCNGYISISVLFGIKLQVPDKVIWFRTHLHFIWSLIPISVWQGAWKRFQIMANSSFRKMFSGSCQVAWKGFFSCQRKNLQRIREETSAAVFKAFFQTLIVRKSCFQFPLYQLVGWRAACLQRRKLGYDYGCSIITPFISSLQMKAFAILKPLFIFLTWWGV